MKNMKNIFLAIVAIMFAATTSFAVTERLGSNLPVQFSATKTLAKTAAYTITTSDSGALFEVTCSNANIVITLPSIYDIAGTSFPVKIIKKDATAYKVIVTPAAGNTIGFESTRYIVGDESYVVIHNEGKDWKVDYETAYIVEDHEAGTYTTGIGSGGQFTVKTTSTTLTGSDCGSVIAVATDAIATKLPPTIANCKLTFVNTGAAGNNILTINPDDADQIFGTVTLAATVVAIVGAAGDSVANTKATSIRGDSMTLIGDGVDGWYIAASTGIWLERGDRGPRGGRGHRDSHRLLVGPRTPRRWRPGHR